MTLSENECDDKTCAKKDWENLKMQKYVGNISTYDEKY